MAGKKTKRPLLVTMGNQKGGVGKSTLTTIMCNYIHENTDLRIAVIDADESQLTISTRRKKDVAYIEEFNDEEGSAVEGMTEDDLYPVYEIGVGMFEEMWKDSIVKWPVDVIFLDFPGNVHHEGVLESYSYCDVILFPFNMVDADWDATEKYINILEKTIKPVLRKDVLIRGIFNRLDMSLSEIRTELALKEDGFYKKALKERGYEMLEHFIPEGNGRYGKHIQTIYAYDKNRKGYSSNPAMKEFVELLEMKLKKLNA